LEQVDHFLQVLALKISRVLQVTEALLHVSHPAQIRLHQSFLQMSPNRRY
jgi:hypothetical protein